MRCKQKSMKSADMYRGRFNAFCQLADDVAGLAVLFVCQQMIDTGMADRFYLYALPLMALTLILVFKSRDRLTARIGSVPSAGLDISRKRQTTARREIWRAIGSAE